MRDKHLENVVPGVLNIKITQRRVCNTPAYGCIVIFLHLLSG